MDSEDEYKNVDSDFETFDDDDGDYTDCIDSEDESDSSDDGIVFGVEEDDEVVGSDKPGSDRHEKSYTVLLEEDIRQQQQKDITQVSNTLSISRVSGTILLRHYNWDVEKAHEAWFSDEEKVRKDVGLLEVVPVQYTDNTIRCGICFDDFPRDNMCAASCGHLFCNLCWTQYINININDGPGCLMLRCPEPSRAVAVGQDMVNELVSDEDKEKNCRYLYKSYIEDRRKTSKWCPGGCEFAIEFDTGSSSYDVVCGCGHSFCWNCLTDAHRPVDCDTVHNWAVKNTAESENLTWILANSKSCPKCKKPIEKNDGCMHMKCPCGFHFCWLCLGAWSIHGKRTGGYLACNIYDKAKAEGLYDEEENLKEKAKNYLDRYAFYFERFVENQKSRLKAVESLKKMQSQDSGKLIAKYGLSEMELRVITDAWLQIIECRRVLRWIYPYGYYLPQSEHAKKQFFEYLQGEAESALERLHQCAEQELQTYLEEDDSPKEFKGFHTKLFELTKTTRIYFENLVRALENGLSDVNSHENGICGRTKWLNLSEKGIEGRGGTSMSSWLQRFSFWTRAVLAIWVLLLCVLEFRRRFI
ncbi:probable E3 ubiquitin-protein ligase ARI7 [Papaver somniferum]|uniref:probable E3 ubiquitin-protein ligase ARI7 n=1 Tax=Papaver somniferum TaxID=3469 RepID=UPI000E6FF307|nr:probable E3 ubiquitin-protein ligase ARI7 [Papaver somniferum]